MLHHQAETPPPSHLTDTAQHQFAVGGEDSRQFRELIEDPQTSHPQSLRRLETASSAASINSAMTVLGGSADQPQPCLSNNSSCQEPLIIKPC